ncbi:hypothetical protein MHBO_000190 [Bonamia ostreae]|uniref:Uncharacterized protein n=1 Tax=Bonamia ostreae TaxID=126728 RepID=A0ABV2AFF3_9EUKA
MDEVVIFDKSHGKNTIPRGSEVIKLQKLKNRNKSFEIISRDNLSDNKSLKTILSNKKKVHIFKEKLAENVADKNKGPKNKMNFKIIGKKIKKLGTKSEMFQKKNKYHITEVSLYNNKSVPLAKKDLGRKLDNEILIEKDWADLENEIRFLDNALNKRNRIVFY